MPVVTVTYTDAERAELNAEGARRGCHACPMCGDSQLWKPFHSTPHFEGVHECPMGDGMAKFHGITGLTALCEECWAKATVEERLTHHQTRHAARKATIKSVVKIPGEGGGLVECPIDLARHAKEHAAHGGEWAAIEAAIREGK